MKDTKKFFTLLIFPLFFIAVAFISSCSPPIGGLLVDSNNYIKAEPYCIVYEPGASFNPKTDVKVFGFFGGVKKDIDIDEVKIQIICVHHPEFVVDAKYTFPTNYGGFYKVVINYRDMETDYIILVSDSDNGNSGGGGGIDVWIGGIIITWE